MINGIYDQPRMFEAFIKSAQYIARLNSKQDVWEHLGKFMTTYFPAAWAVLVQRDDADGFVVLDGTLPDGATSEHLLTPEMSTLIADVMESGFLASQVIHTPAPSMTVLLPLAEEDRTDKVILIGHHTEREIPKELLNIYLALTGLAGVTFERLENTRELVRYRAHLEDLVKERTAELARAKRQNELILQSVGDGVCGMDMEGRITFVSPSAAQILGWTPGELIGQDAHDTFHYRHPDGGAFPVRDCLIHSTLRDGQPRSATGEMFVRRDGTLIPVEFMTTPIMEAERIVGAVMVFRDITERRRAEEALRESERRVRRKLESILSPEGDIRALDLADLIDVPAIQSLMDQFYQFSRIPMAVIDLMGKVLIGVGWSDICTKFHRVHPETCRYCIESDTELSAGVLPGEFKLYKCKNNMWDVATPIMVGGQHVGNLFTGQFFFDGEPLDREFFQAQAERYGFSEADYLAALEDVPRLSEAQLNTGMAFFQKLAHMISQLSYSNIKLARTLTERETLTDSLRRTADDLARSNQDLEQFAYVASHDLQEPLRMVTGFVELLAEEHQGKLGEQSDTYIHYAVDGARRMQVLIDDLLTYSRVGTRGGEIEAIDAGESLALALASLQAAIAESGARITHGELPTVKADHRQLAQLFQNLVGNAIKFRADEPPRIHVDARREAGCWVFAVEDNGIGIDPEFKDRIFLIFQRLHTRQKYAGTGIGLAICKKIVERHGGRIWLESEPGRGARFNFTIPD